MGNIKSWNHLRGRDDSREWGGKFFLKNVCNRVQVPVDFLTYVAGLSRFAVKIDRVELSGSKGLSLETASVRCSPRSVSGDRRTLACGIKVFLSYQVRYLGRSFHLNPGSRCRL